MNLRETLMLIVMAVASFFIHSPFRLLVMHDFIGMFIHVVCSLACTYVGYVTYLYIQGKVSTSKITHALFIYLPALIFYLAHASLRTY